MSEPAPDTRTGPSLIERYQQHRARRHLQHAERYQHRLPALRPQRRRRGLVVALSCVYLVMIGIAVSSLWSFQAAALSWAVVAVVSLSVWTPLSLVAARAGDAPQDALDEFELQQRDAARSIGLTVMQAAVFVPTLILIVLAAEDGVTVESAYMCGLLLTTALVLGATLPTMILAWSRPDPEPDEFLAPATPSTGAADTTEAP